MARFVYVSAISAAAIIALSGCQSEKVPGQLPAAQMRQEKAECKAKGGTYDRAGMFGYACFLQTKDAGKSCTKAGDCESICQAETKTCAAVKPMFGCFSMLNEVGKTEDICID